MPVSDQHKEYIDNLPKWELVRDCIKGSKAIKGRTSGGGTGETTGINTLYSMSGTRYLPPPNPDDVSTQNKDRYIAYRKRASFVNFTGHTKEGMVGMVFSKPMKAALPSSIEYLNGNINGDGLSLEQLSQEVVGDVIEVGRYGLLADYPQAKAGLTQAEVQSLNLSATIQSYKAENIINWRCETIGSINKLVLVVLQEPTDELNDDGFGTTEKMYHRVLLLKDGIYTQNLYNSDGDLVYFGDDKDADIVPRKADGSTWDEIPFVFVGSENNDKSVDNAPLYDISEINIAHYRNSADYEESCFMVGQPTIAIAGLSQGWVDANMKEGIHFGSRAAILLPDGGSAALLQADSNQMPEKGMARKEEQMIMVGARLIQDSSGVETAEAAKIRFAGQNSKLGVIVGNTKDGMLMVLNWALEFMGGGGEIELEYNTQFYDATIDPQLIISQIQLLDRGVIAQKDLRRNLRRSNLIDSERTDEEIDDEASEVEPI